MTNQLAACAATAAQCFFKNCLIGMDRLSWALWWSLQLATAQWQLLPRHALNCKSGCTPCVTGPGTIQPVMVFLTPTHLLTTVRLCKARQCLLCMGCVYSVGSGFTACSDLHKAAAGSCIVCDTSWAVNGAFSWSTGSCCEPQHSAVNWITAHCSTCSRDIGWFGGPLGAKAWRICMTTLPRLVLLRLQGCLGIISRRGTTAV